MRTQGKIEVFLRDRELVLAIAGPSCCGKLYATERAAAAAGLLTQVVDRSSGPHYACWGSNSISSSGALEHSLYVVACAYQETDFSGMLSVLRATPGPKAVLLANEVSNATRNAKIPVERMNAPMPDPMTKELFL